MSHNLRERKTHQQAPKTSFELIINPGFRSQENFGFLGKPDSGILVQDAILAIQESEIGNKLRNFAISNTKRFYLTLCQEFID